MQVRICNTPLLPTDTVKLSFFLEAIPNLEKVIRSVSPVFVGAKPPWYAPETGGTSLPFDLHNTYWIWLTPLLGVPREDSCAKWRCQAYSGQHVSPVSVSNKALTVFRIDLSSFALLFVAVRQN